MRYFCSYKVHAKGNYLSIIEGSCTIQINGSIDESILVSLRNEIKKMFVGQYGEDVSVMIVSFNHLPETEETFEEFVDRKYKSSLNIFGPGERLNGIVEHIREELIEVLENPKDVIEWADVILLAIDGASRQGFTGKEIFEALRTKWSTVEEKRKHPDWRTMSQDEPIKHIKEND